jgi:hypothetical protein
MFLPTVELMISLADSKKNTQTTTKVNTVLLELSAAKGQANVRFEMR